jgi:hypothetical protein
MDSSIRLRRRCPYAIGLDVLHPVSVGSEEGLMIT